MKFLVDRCAGAKLAQWLRQQGHDVLDACFLLASEHISWNTSQHRRGPGM